METEKNRINNIRISTLILYGILGFLFAFFVWTEKNINGSGNILWTKGFVIKTVSLSLVGAVSFCVVSYAIKRVAGNLKETEKGNKSYFVISPALSFVISFILNMISFLPFFLAYFPGIIAYDFPVQIEQIFTNAYNTHHPVIHTLFLEGCIKLGVFLFSSENAGVAICTFIQLTLLGVSFAFVIFTYAYLGKSLVKQILLQILFMIYSFNGYMSVSITKDIVFTSFLLLFLSCSFLFLNGKGKTVFFEVLGIVSAIGVCLFRNNGIYAIFVMLLLEGIFILASKANRKKLFRLFAETLISLAAAFLMSSLLSKAVNATEGDKREMLSVPIQQLARTMVYHESELTDDEKALIDDFILYEGYRDYNPVISDPCKGKTNTSIVRYDTARFAKTYLGLFKKYPGDYVNAFLALIGGYVSPFDESYRVMTVNGEVITRNYIQYADTYVTGTYGDDIHEASVWPKLKERLDRYALLDGFNKPIVREIYVPGVFLWIFLIIFIEAVDKRDVKKIVLLGFPIGFYLTLFLGPTMHLRYLFPLIAVLPLYLLRSNDEA